MTGQTQGFVLPDGQSRAIRTLRQFALTCRREECSELRFRDSHEPVPPAA